MNTDYLPARRTGPPLCFVSNEISYAMFLYVLEIVNHAHTILCSVARIQVDQPGAGKAVATEAVPDSTFRYLLTGLDSARDAGLRFMTVVTSAARAWHPISDIGLAKTTVHSTGSD
jgi:hypothetical protein